MSSSERFKAWAKRVKRDGVTLWFAVRHPAVPWYAKALAAFVVAYALSPIDLIPDFIPVLGYLDDLILLPVLIWLAVRMISGPVLAACRDKAEKWMEAKGAKPLSRIGLVLIVAIWISVTWAFWRYVIKVRFFAGR